MGYQLTVFAENVVAVSDFDSDGRLASIDRASHLSIWKNQKKFFSEKFGDAALLAAARSRKDPNLVKCSIALFRKGNHCIVGSRNGCWILDLERASFQHVDSGHDRNAIKVVAANELKKLIATGGYDGKCTVWTESMERVATFSDHSSADEFEAIQGLGFSGDGGLLVSSREGSICVWDSSTGNQIGKSFYGCDAASISPDNNYVALTDRLACSVHNISDSKLIATFSKHTHSIVDLVFSPDGMLVASASMDKTIRLWDAFSGAEVLKVDVDGEPLQIRWNKNNFVAVLSNGKLLSISFT